MEVNLFRKVKRPTHYIGYQGKARLCFLVSGNSHSSWSFVELAYSEKDDSGNIIGFSQADARSLSHIGKLPPGYQEQ
jgi:hypothetical protein